MNISTNYNGYFVLFRAFLVLIKDKTLNLSDLGAFIIFISQVDWDRKHKNYGLIIRDDKELAREFGIDPTTLYRKRKRFLKKGLFIDKDGITAVPNIYLFDADWTTIFIKFPVAYLQDLFANPLKDLEKMHERIANLQQTRAQKSSKDFNVSSNDRSTFSSEDEDYINSIEFNDEK